MNKLRAEESNIFLRDWFDLEFEFKLDLELDLDLNESFQSYITHLYTFTLL